MIPAEVVSSWADLQERLFGDSWREDLGRFRPNQSRRE